MKHITAFFAALILASVALAQSSSVTKTVGQTATLAWTAPTAYTNGTSIASGTSITYNVYGATEAAGASCPANGTPLATSITTGLTTTTYTTTAFTAAGVQCYAVAAEIAGVQSAQSNIVTVTVAEPTPNPPGTLTVQ